MEDSVFLTKILECPPLTRAVQDMAFRSGAINLVTPDWKNVLESNELYRRHVDHGVRFSKGRDVREKSVNVKSIIGAQNYYNVLVAGYWSLSRPNDVEGSSYAGNNGGTVTFVCRMCEPLVAIAKSMQEAPHFKLQDNCRLFVEPCNPLLCIDCHQVAPVLGDNPWCIRTTRVFNGGAIKNTTKQMIEQTFTYQASFMGIMNVNISSRLTFGDCNYKISGVVKEMLLFKDTSIHPRVKIELDLSLSSALTGAAAVPSISFPEEENEENEEILNEAIPNELRIE